MVVADLLPATVAAGPRRPSAGPLSAVAHPLPALDPPAPALPSSGPETTGHPAPTRSGPSSSDSPVPAVRGVRASSPDAFGAAEEADLCLPGATSILRWGWQTPLELVAPCLPGEAASAVRAQVSAAGCGGLRLCGWYAHTRPPVSPQTAVPPRGPGPSDTGPCGAQAHRHGFVSPRGPGPSEPPPC